MWVGEISNRAVGSLLQFEGGCSLLLIGLEVVEQPVVRDGYVFPREMDTCGVRWGLIVSLVSSLSQFYCPRSHLVFAEVWSITACLEQNLPGLESLGIGPQVVHFKQILQMFIDTLKLGNHYLLYHFSCLSLLQNTGIY